MSVTILRVLGFQTNNPQGLSCAASVQAVADPLRMTLVVTMTVRAVVHDLAVEDAARGVYLPEDDTTVAAAPQTVAQCCMLHLSLTEIAVGYQGTAEVAIG